MYLINFLLIGLHVCMDSFQFLTFCFYWPPSFAWPRRDWLFGP